MDLTCCGVDQETVAELRTEESLETIGSERSSEQSNILGLPSKRISVSAMNGSASGRRGGDRRSKNKAVSLKDNMHVQKAPCDMSLESIHALICAHSVRLKELEARYQHTLGGADSFRLNGELGDVTPEERSYLMVDQMDKDTGAGVGEVAGKESSRHPVRFVERRHGNARRRGALCSGALMAMLGMPFGPVGMVFGVILGAITGGMFGHLIDRRKINAQLHDSEVLKRRLESLSRWAMARSHDEEEVRRNLDFVILEFKPVADAAEQSTSARKLLRLLDKWVANKVVTKELWVYMDNFLLKWRSRTRDDIINTMHIFQTLSAMYRHSTRKLSEYESRFLLRIERLLNHESVEVAMAQAETGTSTIGNSRVMTSLFQMDEKVRSDIAMSPKMKQRAESFPRIAEEDDLPDSDEELDANGEQAADGISEDECDAMPGSTSPHRSVASRGEPLPFFKSWHDYMEFDLNIKHKIPITRCEFDFLLQKEREDEKGWDLTVDRKEIRICKTMAGQGTVFVRGWATIPVDYLAAFHLFYDTEMRVKWDTVFAEMKLAEQPVKGSDVLYSLLRIPFVTPRDFVQYRRVMVLEDGAILIVLRSAEHPSFPENKQFIRAESYISGYVLRGTTDCNGNPELKLFLMACTDVKGLIPKWIINTGAAKKPADWVDALKRGTRDFQEANPGYREELAGILDRFKHDNAEESLDDEISSPHRRSLDEISSPRRQPSPMKLPAPVEAC